MVVVAAACRGRGRARCRRRRGRRRRRSSCGSTTGVWHAAGSVVARLRDLEQHAAHRVVDLLVVLVLVLAAEAREHRPEPDLLAAGRVAERDAERDRERVLVGVSARPRSPRLRTSAAARPSTRRASKSTSNSPCTMLWARKPTVANSFEMPAFTLRVVAAVRRELHAERRKELVVRDVLHLGADDPPRDLVLLVLRAASSGSEPTMRLCSRANSVWIAVSAMFSLARTSPATTASVGLPGQLAHEVHRRGGRGVARARDRRQIAVRQHEQRVPSRVAVSQARSRARASTPYTFERVDVAAESCCTCWRGVVTPVPGAAGVRVERRSSRCRS